MNDLMIIAIIGIGLVLIYAAVKGQTPQEIIAGVFGGNNA